MSKASRSSVPLPMVNGRTICDGSSQAKCSVSNTEKEDQQLRRWGEDDTVNILKLSDT